MKRLVFFLVLMGAFAFLAPAAMATDSSPPTSEVWTAAMSNGEILQAAQTHPYALCVAADMKTGTQPGAGETEVADMAATELALTSANNYKFESTLINTAQARDYSRTLSAVAEQAKVDVNMATSATPFKSLASENENITFYASGREVPYVVISPMSSLMAEALDISVASTYRRL